MSSTVGPYRLLKPLGQGGMGEVWEAEPTAGGAHVAVKMLPATTDGESSTLRRFLGEARIGQNLRHANIVEVLDAGVDNGRAFMSMELLEGRTLSALPKEPLPIPLVVALANQALGALDHAHTFIVHRDIKPSNLFLTNSGVLKVIDFGIAMWGDLERTRTATGLLRGSLPYSTPEQARNEGSDARSDLFSLGLVLHELLTGRRVFAGNSDAAIVTALMMLPIPRLRDVRPEVSEALDNAISSALERERDKRPASASAMLQLLAKETAWSDADVAAWLARQPTRGSPAPSGTESLISAPTMATPGPRAKAPRSSRRGMVVGGALLLIGAGAGAGFFATQPPLQPTQPVAIAPPTQPVVAPAGVDAGVVEAPTIVDAGAPVETAKAQPPPTKHPAGSGWLTIDARPSWGTVYIDGKKLGPTPLYRQVVAEGRHIVEIEKEDGTRKRRKLVVAAGKEQQVIITW